MLVDPLSQVLALLRPQSAVSIGIDTAGDWAFQFSAHEGIKFNAAMHGACWLRVGDDATWHHIQQGSCFLLTQGLPFALASDPAVPLRDAALLYQDVTGSIARWNGGGELFIVGGRFTFPRSDGAALLAALPPVVVIDALSPQAGVLQWSLNQLAAEMRQAGPGSALLAEHLAHFMLVHILRLHLGQAGGLEGKASWLQALTDRQLSRAMSAIHEDPKRRWTLAELASHAGMSRTVFAERFRRVVGLSAIDYLTRWRMLLARDRLRHGTDSIASVALSVGYQSEAAFSTAFKRLHHASPRRFRHGLA